MNVITFILDLIMSVLTMFINYFWVIIGIIVVMYFLFWLWSKFRTGEGEE